MLVGAAVGTRWREEAGSRFVVDHGPTRLLRAVGALLAVVGAQLLVQGAIGVATGKPPALIQVEGASGAASTAPSLIFGIVFGPLGAYLLTWSRRVEIDRQARSVVETRRLFGRASRLEHPLAGFNRVQLREVGSVTDASRKHLQASLEGPGGEVVLARFTWSSTRDAQSLGVAASAFARLELDDCLS